MTDESRPEAPALEYARALHNEFLETNRGLYSRAQIILTVDGLIIGFFTALLSSLYSLHRSGRPSQRSDPSIDTHMWFYARIAEIRPAMFLKRSRQIGTDDELTIRTQQITVMAPIMRRRADWINAAYAFAAAAFLAQLLAGTSYLIDL